MRLGAHDYLAKPIDLGMLRLQVRNAFEHYRLRRGEPPCSATGWPSLARSRR